MYIIRLWGWRVKWRINYGLGEVEIEKWFVRILALLKNERAKFMLFFVLIFFGVDFEWRFIEHFPTETLIVLIHNVIFLLELKIIADTLIEHLQ